MYSTLTGILRLPRYYQAEKAMDERAMELLKVFDLDKEANYTAANLPYGKQRKLEIARAMATEPKLLLLDEPFSALDYQTRLMVSADICHLIRQTGKTMMIITHDLSEAISLADRVVILSSRPATVKKELPIHLTLQDDSPLAARYAPEFQDYFSQLWEVLTDENRD